MQDDNNTITEKEDDYTHDEVDLSEIQIIDTSKGDLIDFSEIVYKEIHSFICRSCGFKYEGTLRDESCPKCGSDDVMDT